MKKILLSALILFNLFCCKKTASSKQTVLFSEKIATPNLQETYSHTKINDKKIEETYSDFNGEGGSKVTGFISSFILEIPENTLGKDSQEIKFTYSMKKPPLMLQQQTYHIKGIESDDDYIENNKDDTFYCVDALTMDTYKKMQETYKTLDKEDFLEVLYYDYVVIPDTKNSFEIESIKEIEGANEFIEISEGKGIRNNEYIIQGNFQIKLMKVSTKEEFTIQTKFKTEYIYGYSDL